MDYVNQIPFKRFQEPKMKSEDEQEIKNRIGGQFPVVGKPNDKKFSQRNLRLEKKEGTISVFTNQPKTRRRVGPRCVSRDRAINFMEYLWEQGFRDRLSYEALKLQFILFFGTNDNRTVERYIGRPKVKKRSSGLAHVMRLNRNKGTVACFTYSNFMELSRKKGLMEILGYISILEDGTVILHHEVMPYYTKQVKLEEVCNNEVSNREVFSRSSNQEVNESSDSSILNLCVHPLCGSQGRAGEGEGAPTTAGDGNKETTENKGKEKKEEVIDSTHTNSYLYPNMNREFYDKDTEHRELVPYLKRLLSAKPFDEEPNGATVLKAVLRASDSTMVTMVHEAEGEDFDE